MTTIDYTLITSVTSAETAGVPPLSHETNHEGVGVDYLLVMYRDKPRMKAFLEAFLAQVQSLEDICWELLTKRYLDDMSTVPYGTGAVGVQLDGIGNLVGEPRNGKTDDAYRTFIRVRILVNTSDGKIEQLNNILNLIGFETIEIDEKFPAHMDIFVTQAVYPLETARFMNEAKGGGVGMHLIYSMETMANTFQFSGTYNTLERNSTTGFGYVNSSTLGGQMAGVFE